MVHLWGEVVEGDTALLASKFWPCLHGSPGTCEGPHLQVCWGRQVLWAVLGINHTNQEIYE